MTRVGVFVLTLVLSAALLTSCAGSQSAAPATSTSGSPGSSTAKPSAAAPKELKIGTLASMSGPLAAFGIAHSRGTDLAVEEINAAGGIKVGTDTYVLKAVHEDDKTDSASATAAAQKLYFQDGVKFFVTGSTIASLAVWSAVAGPQKMLELQLGVADNIIGPEKPSAFRAYASGNETIASLVGAMKKLYPGKTKIAIIVRNDPAGIATFPPTEQAATALGFSVVAKETVPIPTTDFLPVLTKILPLKPDFIVANVGPTEQGLLLKQSKDMGWDGPVIGTGEGPAKETFDVGGKDNVQGRYYSPSGDLTSPQATKEERDLATKYQQKYNEPVTGMVPNGYNQIMIIKAAMEKAGSLDTDKLVKALESMDSVPTVHGPAKWGGQSVYGNNHQLYYPLNVSVAKDGGWSVLEKVSVESFYRP